jgi:hypothetical protein
MKSTEPWSDEYYAVDMEVCEPYCVVPYFVVPYCPLMDCYANISCIYGGLLFYAGWRIPIYLLDLKLL